MNRLFNIRSRYRKNISIYNFAGFINMMLFLFGIADFSEGIRESIRNIIRHIIVINSSIV